MSRKRFFISDNAAPAHPEIVEALAAADSNHAYSYGGDVYTDKLRELLKNIFKAELLLCPVFTGSAANVLAIAAVSRPGEGVLAAPCAHIGTDEGGAMEALVGAKQITLPCDNRGLVQAASLATYVPDRKNVHHSQPRLLSLSQTTERGGFYSATELRALCTEAHKCGLLVHLDGARLAQAVAASLLAENNELDYTSESSLDLAYKTLRAMTVEAGVDLLSLGGTKNGGLGAEALLAFIPNDTSETWRTKAMADVIARLPFLQKTFLQLGSKMRYVSLQLYELFRNNLWLRLASAACLRTRELATKLSQAGVISASSVPLNQLANALFVELPAHIIPSLVDEFRCYVWDAEKNEVRIMTSWDTETSDIDAFVTACTRQLSLAQQKRN